MLDHDLHIDLQLWVHAASDERAEKEFTDTEAVLDALNLKTEGGLTTILEAVEGKRTSGLSGG